MSSLELTGEAPCINNATRVERLIGTRLYDAGALSVLFGDERLGPDCLEVASTLSWFELRPDGLYVVDKAGVDESLIDLITGDIHRTRKDGRPILRAPFSIAELLVFDFNAGRELSGRIPAVEAEALALIHELRSQSPDAAELAGFLFEAAKRSNPPAAAVMRLSELGRVERWEKLWQLCVDAGLQMPERTDTYRPFPIGIGRIANDLGWSVARLSKQLRAYREHCAGASSKRETFVLR